jgi:hypothetical protein
MVEPENRFPLFLTMQIGLCMVEPENRFPLFLTMQKERGLSAPPGFVQSGAAAR